MQQFAETGLKPGQRFQNASNHTLKDFLTVQNELVFKGQQREVPASLQKELMAVLHNSHIDIERCITEQLIPATVLA